MCHIVIEFLIAGSSNGAMDYTMHCLYYNILFNPFINISQDDLFCTINEVSKLHEGFLTVYL